MIKFNTNHIVVGYIKQLLTSFNLPTYRVYTKEQAEYAAANGIEKNVIESIRINEPEYADPITGSKYGNVRYISYIKDGSIQRYVNGKWEYVPEKYGDKIVSAIKPYYFNAKILNHTKNLKIRNNMYDSYTHEYLGNYLRFIRDYTGVNLMPLYNCFSDRTCEKLYINCKHSANNNEQHFIFNSSDSNYKIYMLPVKLFQQYTIAIDCAGPVEVCCGIYGKYQDTRKEKFLSLSHSTYARFTTCQFDKPQLYTKLQEIDEYLTTTSLMELAEFEQDLKLFIKVPVSNDSSITILEGDYTSYSNTFTTVSDNVVQKQQNRAVINYEQFLKSTNKINTKMICPLQLLQANTKVSRPFADRLLEYLFGQAITNQEEIADNVQRVQAIMQKKKLTRANHGLWEDKYSLIFYDFMMRATDANIQALNKDILGYVDKDIEKYFYYRDPQTGKKTTLENIDIYPGMYTGDK